MLNVTDNFEVAKRTSKGQMTLPVRAREKLGLKKGDHLAVHEIKSAFTFGSRFRQFGLATIP